MNTENEADKLQLQLQLRRNPLTGKPEHRQPEELRLTPSDSEMNTENEATTNLATPTQETYTNKTLRHTGPKI